jgi:CDP-glucose 4,6-dehydratase
MFWKNKKVLITGNTGFKGTWLTLLLSHLGAKISGYSNNIPTNPSLYELCDIKKNIKTNIDNIIDMDSLEYVLKKYKPEIIFHLAAQPLVIESYKNPIETYLTNLCGTISLYEVVRILKINTTIITITTDKVYERSKFIELYDCAYSENDKLGGHDIYSSSKACAEIATDSYRSSFFNIDNYDKHKISIATARAGNVIGGGDFSKDRLITDFINSISNNKSIVLRNPNAIRPWQHVLDCLYGYIQLAEKLYNNPIKYSGAYNFGPDKNNITVLELVNKLYKIWDKDNDDIEIYDTNNLGFNETKVLKLDSAKAKKELGFNPIYDIDKTLELTIDWHKRYLNGENMYDVCMNQIIDYLKVKNE